MIEEGSTNLKDLAPGDYMFDDFCVEPTSFKIKEESLVKGQEPKFVETKLATRLTYTLASMSGKMKVGGNGAVEMVEEDGLDYAPVTVRLPGGEYQPFMFAVKEMKAQGTLDKFGGDFVVPSYRGSTFMDPKGRGASTGYETQPGLQAAGDQTEYQRENDKNIAPAVGKIVLSTAKVDPATGEIAGVFQSLQVRGLRPASQWPARAPNLSRA